ncbi:Site-specific DNA-methyltransferase (adenine-specific) [Methylorubrum extorquens]
MFAEDVGLLPDQLFSRMLLAAKGMPGQFETMASELFRAMRAGGMAAWHRIEWFNGGLFDDDTALTLDKEDIEIVAAAAALDWADIDPTIFGTLFERSLDPGKRSQLGAHYTDRAKIMLIIEPVIVRPLLAEWEADKEAITEALERSKAAKSLRLRKKARDAAVSLYRAFLARLRAFTVLDPACGSGNFLYLALLALKDLEQQVMIEAETLDPEVLPREFPSVGPAAVKGIEINSFAAELARVTVWIGEIQWMRRNGWDVSRNPILKPLHTIECRDALLNPDGTEAAWPQADVIVGNPPFLGGKLMRERLGDTYVSTLRNVYQDQLPSSSDFVCYWFTKTRLLIENDTTKRAGLVSTNSIRGGSNRETLDRITKNLKIYSAWADEGWVLDGASVRVSLISFAKRVDVPAMLDGAPCARINSDLSSSITDVTAVKRLPENASVCFEGGQPHGPFDVEGHLARQWLQGPSNPNGSRNSEILRPYLNGMDVARRPADRWMIDVSHLETEAAVSFYEEPYKYLRNAVLPIRLQSKDARKRQLWWVHHRSRPALRAAANGLARVIATPVVAKHRIFVWVPSVVWASNLVDVITRDDDTAFGILHSRFHEAWSLRLCTWLGVGNDPRYTPTTTFETFPFPKGLTPNLPASTYAADPRSMRIAAAAKRLDDLRSNWLNPPDYVLVTPEVVGGFPDRILPKDEKAAAVLKTRTLTNLYNKRLPWLDEAHQELDAAVAAAYGWPEDISDEDALSRLLALNLNRASG